MRNLKLLVVEGNNKADNANFLEAGCVSQSENFIKHIKMFQTNCDIDKVEPVNDNAIFKAVNDPTIPAPITT